MDKNSPNLEEVLKSLKNFEIQKVVRGLKGLNFPEEIDSLIKSEIDKSCSKSTPFDVEEWLALLWRRVDLLHKECNRYLAMVGGGSGVISIATLFWTLIGLWSTKNIGDYLSFFNHYSGKRTLSISYNICHLIYNLIYFKANIHSIQKKTSPRIWIF